MAMMWSLQRSQDSLQFLLGWKSVCLHIKPFFVLTDIQPNQVSALILHPINREVQALWSQSYDTGSYVTRYSVPDTSERDGHGVCWMSTGSRKNTHIVKYIYHNVRVFASYTWYYIYTSYLYYRYSSEGG